MNLSDYIYVLPEHPMRKSETDFKFLSVRKITFNVQVGERIYLMYRKSQKSVPGIIGFCFVAGKPKKVRTIPKKNRHLCFNRSFYQIPIKEIQCSIRNMIDEDVLYSLPVLNERARKRVYKECSMIETYSLEKSLSMRSKYWHIWRSRRSDEEIKEYNQLYVHELRENYSKDHKVYSKLIKGVTKCLHCGISHESYQPYTPQFFEFHEINTCSVTKKYNKIDYSKFIALCPNCHKKAHEQMVQQSFYDTEYGYTGFDIGFLASGWKVEYFRKYLD